MITHAIFTFFSTVALALLSPILNIPDASIPSGISTAITQAGAYLQIIDVVVPVDTLIQVIASVIAVDAAILAYKLIMWVIHKIPGIT